MTPLRWGILGASNFALTFMGRAIHAAQGAELAALATSSPDKAKPFQAFAPGLRVHDSYDALLADPDIDCVYIPLPNHLHIEWTIKALEAGKHVLCEKPLAMRADAFDAVIEARDKSGLLAAEAYMIVHHPQFIRARELVQTGAIGKLRHVDTVFSYNNRDMGNIRNQAEAGGGGLPDIGVYTFGSVRFVSGQEPVAVPYADITFENDIDTFVRMSADFPDFTYSAIVSIRIHPRQYIAFHGEEGVLTLTAPFNAGVFDQAEIRLDTGDRKVTVERFPGVNQYVLQVENFGRAVREGSPYACPLEFSKGTQRMIDMTFDAARG
ncbi:Gfo/Idh/MocA family oxidoreductase [Sulfitobacter sp. D35]|uniref:Gfo/Idh/MocA family protein n=1 Tax=Sulfitobacter sp. D35 TaxID=3083252 RepID=UPI00296F15DC|nr:Gfo/Idh/MocA family oxidoreductase [Sulfitobacter sp. D35]MDW4496993.1 Gfo/Idh/MocA family oxidoreductase [Sulfitobacter sp. D35]